MPAPAYKPGEQVATREAWGTALAALGAVDRRVVALDADVKNSTFSDEFEKAFPDRFYQNFIAEQVMVGAAMGLAARGAIAVRDDVCVLPHARRRLHPHGRPVDRAPPAQRQADRLARRRLDRRGRAVADGARGSGDDARACPIAPCIYPVRRRQHRAAGRRDGAAITAWPTCGRRGPRPTSSTAPTRRSRSAARRSSARARTDVATVVGAGVTVFEALKAHDQLKAHGITIRVIDAYSVQPIDAATLIAAGKPPRAVIITVEDHYRAGGLGDAVGAARRSGRPDGPPPRRSRAPRSGQPDELLDRYGISARHIVDAVTGSRPERARC